MQAGRHPVGKMKVDCTSEFPGQILAGRSEQGHRLIGNVWHFNEFKADVVDPVTIKGVVIDAPDNHRGG